MTLEEAVKKIQATVDKRTKIEKQIQEQIKVQEQVIVELKIDLKKQGNLSSDAVKTLENQTAVQISQNKRRVVAGLINSQETKGYYKVQVGQKEIRVKSALSQTLIPNTEVVLGETENGFFIIGAGKSKDKTQKIVTITG